MTRRPRSRPFEGPVGVGAGTAEQQEVRSADQGIQLGRPSGAGRIDDAAGLAGVEGQEMRTGPADRRAGSSPIRIALRGLDLDHPGAGVAEQLGAVGQPAWTRQFDNRQIGEQGHDLQASAVESSGWQVAGQLPARSSWRQADDDRR